MLSGAAAPPGIQVDSRALQQVRRSADLLARRAERELPRAARQEPALPRDVAVGALLAFAYPDRIGMSRGGDTGRYLLAQGRGANLTSPAALARSEFIVAAELDAGEREAKIQLAAPLTREWLERCFERHIQSVERSPGIRARNPSWPAASAASVRWCSTNAPCMARRRPGRPAQ